MSVPSLDSARIWLRRYRDWDYEPGSALGLCMCRHCKTEGEYLGIRIDRLQRRSSAGRKHWDGTIPRGGFISASTLFALYVQQCHAWFGEAECASLCGPPGSPRATSSEVPPEAAPAWAGPSSPPSPPIHSHVSLPTSRDVEPPSTRLASPPTEDPLLLPRYEYLRPVASFGPAPYFKPTVYTDHGSVHHYVERRLMMNTCPPTSKFCGKRMPGRDGCVLVAPLADAQEMMSDPEMVQVASLVADMVEKKCKYGKSQASFKDEVSCWTESGIVGELPSHILRQHASTYPKAMRFLQKMGMGMNVYVYHVCPKADCSHVFRNETRDLDHCPCKGCGHPRYKGGSGDIAPEKRTPFKKLYYLSVHEWVSSLMDDPEVAQLLNWHKQRSNTPGVEVDIYDTKLWSLFLADDQMTGRGFTMLCGCIVCS